MIDALLVALKWGCLGNSIFMLIWTGFRISADHPASWILLDAFIVVATILIAGFYRDEGV